MFEFHYDTVMNPYLFDKGSWRIYELTDSSGTKRTDSMAVEYIKPSDFFYRNGRATNGTHFYGYEIVYFNSVTQSTYIEDVVGNMIMLDKDPFLAFFQWQKDTCSNCNIIPQYLKFYDTLTVKGHIYNDVRLEAFESIHSPSYTLKYFAPNVGLIKEETISNHKVISQSMLMRYKTILFAP